MGAVKQPTGGRNIHARPTPELGGLAIGLVLFGGIWLLSAWGLLGQFEIRPVQVYGFLFAVWILLVGGLLDDLFQLPPRVLIWFPCFAALTVILTGTGIVQVTNLAQAGGFSLVWWRGMLGPVTISLPSDVLTFVWLVLVTMTTKFMDGLDGLVTGQTVIGAAVIAGLALTTAFFQPVIVLFAVVIAAAFLGFLPWNFHPARQFLGEAGSTIAGFSLGFLAIVSGTKVATALMVLGLPLVDLVFVVIGRLRRGVSPAQGDTSHLHFKLLQAGLSQRQSVLLIWSMSLAFGVAGLVFQTRGKLLMLLGLVMATAALTIWAGMRAKRRAQTAV
jgi:UDP-GlcNAc:undecaprenyl-phosphate GlcNAc-1-phosphate transferase